MDVQAENLGVTLNPFLCLTHHTHCINKSCQLSIFKFIWDLNTSSLSELLLLWYKSTYSLIWTPAVVSVHHFPLQHIHRAARVMFLKIQIDPGHSCRFWVHSYEQVSLAWHSDGTKETSPRGKIPGGQKGPSDYCAQLFPRLRLPCEDDGRGAGFHVHSCSGAPSVGVKSLGWSIEQGLYKYCFIFCKYFWLTDKHAHYFWSLYII